MRMADWYCLCCGVRGSLIRGASTAQGLFRLACERCRSEFATGSLIFRGNIAAATGQLASIPSPRVRDLDLDLEPVVAVEIAAVPPTPVPASVNAPHGPVSCPACRALIPPVWLAGGVMGLPAHSEGLCGIAPCRGSNTALNAFVPASGIDMSSGASFGGLLVICRECGANMVVQPGETHLREHCHMEPARLGQRCLSSGTLISNTISQGTITGGTWSEAQATASRIFGSNGNSYTPGSLREPGQSERVIGNALTENDVSIGAEAEDTVADSAPPLLERDASGRINSDICPGCRQRVHVTSTGRFENHSDNRRPTARLCPSSRNVSPAYRADVRARREAQVEAHVAENAATHQRQLAAAIARLTRDSASAAPADAVQHPSGQAEQATYEPEVQRAVVRQIIALCPSCNRDIGVGATPAGHYVFANHTVQQGSAQRCVGTGQLVPVETIRVDPPVTDEDRRLLAEGYNRGTGGPLHQQRNMTTEQAFYDAIMGEPHQISAVDAAAALDAALNAARAREAAAPQQRESADAEAQRQEHASLPLETRNRREAALLAAVSSQAVPVASRFGVCHICNGRVSYSGDGRLGVHPGAGHAVCTGSGAIVQNVELVRTDPQRLAGATALTEATELYEIGSQQRTFVRGRSVEIRGFPSPRMDPRSNVGTAVCEECRGFVGYDADGRFAEHTFSFGQRCSGSGTPALAALAATTAATCPECGGSVVFTFDGRFVEHVVEESVGFGGSRTSRCPGSGMAVAPEDLPLPRVEVAPEPVGPCEHGDPVGSPGIPGPPGHLTLEEAYQRRQEAISIAHRLNGLARQDRGGSHVVTWHGDYMRVARAHIALQADPFDPDMLVLTGNCATNSDLIARDDADYGMPADADDGEDDMYVTRSTDCILRSEVDITSEQIIQAGRFEYR